MALKRITQPTEEPITLQEAKEHIRVSITEEDQYIEPLIKVARETCEEFQNRAYVEQSWLLTFDNWPQFPVKLPRVPLQAVTKIEYKTEDGTLNEWDSNNYAVDDVSEPGRIALRSNYNIPGDNLYPINGIQITYTAGYSENDNIPERVKHAMKLLIGHWYENREAIVLGSAPRELPFAVKALLSYDRVMPT